MNSSSLDKKIPVLVISGFLGSGKTTLLSYLLKKVQAKGVHIAVVSNEFGALGIDRALLGQGGEAYVELEGGCVCCQLSDELVNTRYRCCGNVCILTVSSSRLQASLCRSTRSSRSGVNRFVAGLTTTWPWSSSTPNSCSSRGDLDGTFEDQVSSADLLLLNKIDLVPPQSLAALEVVLHRMAPDTPVVHAMHGQVDPSVLFPPVLRDLRTQRRTAGGEPARHRHESFLSYSLL